MAAMLRLFILSQLCLPILCSQGLLVAKGNRSIVATCPHCREISVRWANPSRNPSRIFLDPHGTNDCHKCVDAYTHVHRRHILTFEDVPACSMTENKRFPLLVRGPFPSDKFAFVPVTTTLGGDCASFTRISTYALSERLRETTSRVANSARNTIAGVEVWGKTAFVPPTAGDFVCFVNVSVVVDSHESVTLLELRGSARESPFKLVGLSNRSLPQPLPTVMPTFYGKRLALRDFEPGSLLLQTGNQFTYAIMLHNPSETELLQVRDIRSASLTGSDKLYLTVPGSDNMRWSLQSGQTLQVAEVSFAFEHVYQSAMRSLIHITAEFQSAWAHSLGGNASNKLFVQDRNSEGDTVELVVPINVCGYYRAAFIPPRSGLRLRWSSLARDNSNGDAGFRQSCRNTIDRHSGEETQPEFSYGQWFLARSDEHKSGVAVLGDILFDGCLRLFVLLTMDDTIWGELWHITLFYVKGSAVGLVILGPLFCAVCYVTSLDNFLCGEALEEDRKQRRGQRVQAGSHATLETACKIVNRLNVFGVKNPTKGQLDLRALARKLNNKVLLNLHQHHITDWSTLVRRPDVGSWRFSPKATHDKWMKKGLGVDGVGLHGFGLGVWVRNLYAHSEELVGNGLFAHSEAVDEYLTTRFPWLAKLLASFKRTHLDPTADWSRWLWRLAVTVAKKLARLVVMIVLFIAVLFAIGFLQYKGWLPHGIPLTAE